MSAVPPDVLPAGGLPGAGASHRTSPLVPRWAVVAAAVFLAAVAAHLIATERVSTGAALIAAVCVGPIAFLDLPLALALYVAVLYVQDIPGLSIGPNSMGVLVAAGWAGTIAVRRPRSVLLRGQGTLLAALALFALWITLTITWTHETTLTGEAIKSWLIAALGFLVAATALPRARDVKLVTVAYVLGSTASVLYGMASGDLTAAASTANEAARFTGGGGDPNVQAAGFVAGMFLCAGLWGLARTGARRAALAGCFVAITIGFFLTQSRGGLLALGVAAIAGIVLLPRQRRRLLALAGAALIGLAFVAATSPSAVERMTNIGGGTSGRSDLWTVAARIFQDHPWAGIGLGSFQTVEPSYTLRSGPLTRVDLVAQEPHLVHNLYLQLATETGVIGLALFLFFIFMALRSSWLAGRSFERLGRPALADLAGAVMMGSIGMLAAQIFISDGDDWRMWILLGIGPALLTLARQTPPREAESLRVMDLRRPPGRQRPRDAVSSS